MDDIGYGLLDRELIRRVTDRWHRGGVGLLYLQLLTGSDTDAEAAKAWAIGQRRVFWHIRLGREYLFFVNRTGDDERLGELLSELARDICARLSVAADEGGSGLALGKSTAVPTNTGRSAETIIFTAIKEAMLEAGRRAAQGQAARTIGTAPQELRPKRETANPIGELASPIPTFRRSTRVSEIARFFETDAHVQGAIITDGGRPVGLVMKEKLHQLLAGQFGLPLYWSRPVERIMDHEPLVVDASVSIEQVSQMAMARDVNKLYDVVAITQGGQFVGAASIRSILESITKLRTEAARSANPLTGLPGNEMIQRELQRRIQAGRPFSAVYVDLDYFKWFNDCFGFRRGDEMIRYTADVLTQVLGVSGTREDFIGHIGGDDFIFVTEADDPVTICRQIIWRFDGGVKSFYDGASVTRVSDRDGRELERDGVTISLSLMRWNGHAGVTPELISEQAARLKKRAKQEPGSVYVMAEVGQWQLGEDQIWTRSH